MNSSKFKSAYLVACLVLWFVTSCQSEYKTQKPTISSASPSPISSLKPLHESASAELKLLVQSALEQTKVTTGYDPSYVSIDYPGGDVPLETGVCSDVVVRAFRKAGIDLQKQIHEDMKRAWSSYPNNWGATRPDSNIDHRRVPNLMVYFDRKGKTRPTTSNPEEYLPGDIVAWDLGNGVDHIGIVVNQWSESSQRHLVVHNIGRGARCEDVLFNWKITGHYRYF